MQNPNDIIVIGGGIAGLTSAALLVKAGFKVKVLEQNWIPGGCTTSYPRHKFVFEAGATTLVGLNQNMSLRYLLDQTGIELKVRKLELPMQVHLKNGEVLNRYQDLDQWIEEAKRVFGEAGQEAFWRFCYGVSENVWDTSLKQRAFPPDKASDLWQIAKNTRMSQIRDALFAFKSTKSTLEKFGLEKHERFGQFVNEQLMITAQNTAPEVNTLFGATALCYTNYDNYYIDGGMINLVKPLVEYIESKGSEVLLRASVERIEKVGQTYRVHTKKQGTFETTRVVSSVPVNDTLPLFQNGLAKKLEGKTLSSEQLNSAFQMGIAFKRHREYETIHHQIHVNAPLPLIGSESIFVSLSHAEDTQRCGPDECVASISTHFPDPENLMMENKEAVEQAILDTLVEKDFLRPENVLYQHSATPKAWHKWTRRKWGFVGGYPQYMNIKPWQMLSARLDGEGAYICGDSTYPGQGIPGACLSGIIAAEKLIRDAG